MLIKLVFAVASCACLVYNRKRLVRFYFRLSRLNDAFYQQEVADAVLSTMNAAQLTDTIYRFPVVLNNNTYCLLMEFDHDKFMLDYNTEEIMHDNKNITQPPGFRYVVDLDNVYSTQTRQTYASIRELYSDIRDRHQ